MAKLIIYQLESSAVLAFLYIIYMLALSRETFFNFNRSFLIGMLVFSLVFPLMRVDFNATRIITVERPINAISKVRMSYYQAIVMWEFEGYRATRQTITQGYASKPLPPNINWVKISFTTLLILYGIGVGVCLSRLVWALRWIRKMITTYPLEIMDGMKVIKVPNQIAPFSFLNYIFVYEAVVNTAEFDQILLHEKTHIQGRHSIDLLFIQFLAAFFWFNPLVWRLIKSLKMTHEYIADKAILHSGYSLDDYQALLLRQLVSNHSFGLVHNFNLSFIKKRITMMKNKPSGGLGKAKVAMVMATTMLITILLLQCNSKIEDQILIKPQVTSIPVDDFTHGINLPVLPQTGYVFEGKLSAALNLTISANKLTINGESHAVDEIIEVIEKGRYPMDVTVVMRIDKDQTMDFVRVVQRQIRKAALLKVLYLGQTSMGAKVETPLLLPPLPANSLLPTTEDLMGSEKIELLKIDLGNNDGPENQQKVYNFVKSQISKQSENYVISAAYKDDDTYKEYLLNLIYIKEGFNQIYQERAHQMFRKDFYKTDKEQYLAVRKGIPTAISIAEG